MCTSVRAHSLSLLCPEKPISILTYGTPLRRLVRRRTRARASGQYVPAHAGYPSLGATLRWPHASPFVLPEAFICASPRTRSGVYTCARPPVGHSVGAPHPRAARVAVFVSQTVAGVEACRSHQGHPLGGRLRRAPQIQPIPCEAYQPSWQPDRAWQIQQNAVRAAPTLSSPVFSRLLKSSLAECTRSCGPASASSRFDPKEEKTHRARASRREPCSCSCTEPEEVMSRCRTQRIGSARKVHAS